MPRLVIFGCGGFGREILRVARQSYENIAFASDQPCGPLLGVPVIAPTEIRPDDELVVAIGNSPTRKAVIERFPGNRLASLVAPTAIIGEDVEIGPGLVLCDQTAILGSARIGSDFQCNVYSYIGHDCVIGDNVTFGPRVSCNGNVHIGDGAHIAAGVLIRNGTAERPLRIGAGAFVGMGVSIVRDVPPGARIVPVDGLPARSEAGEGAPGRA